MGTTVELLPIQAFVDEKYLIDKGLSNYWGYNTIGFFAPQPRYLATGSVNEVKEMVSHLQQCRDRNYSRCCLQSYRGRKRTRPDTLL